VKNERRIQILANKQLMYVYIQKMHNYPILVLMLYAPYPAPIWERALDG